MGISNPITISVVIPMYNAVDTIVDALESVRKQTVAECIKEVIIVNDGSSDASVECVEFYAKENRDIKISIISQKNKGVSAARNIGMKHATGEWIALLDADDEWCSWRLERQIKCIKEHPEIDFIGGAATEGPLWIITKKISSLYRATVKDLTLKSFPVTPSILMRKKIFDEIGGYKEDQHYAEDGQYCLRICRRYGFYYLPEKLVNCGHGKRSFGDWGLSANMKGMHFGTIANIKELYNEKIISLTYYLFLRVFYFVKYMRRIVITKLS